MLAKLAIWYLTRYGGQALSDMIRKGEMRELKKRADAARLTAHWSPSVPNAMRKNAE